jgi:Arc/MetJ family transcription regulator
VVNGETKDALIARVLRLEHIVEQQKAAENALRDEIVRFGADRPSLK